MINYYLTRLLISPIFPYLPFIFGVSLFLSLKYFEPAYFCDGESIEELKNQLSEETIKYNGAMKELNDLNEKTHQTVQAKQYDSAFHYELKAE